MYTKAWLRPACNVFLVRGSGAGLWLHVLSVAQKLCGHDVSRFREKSLLEICSMLCRETIRFSDN